MDWLRCYAVFFVSASHHEGLRMSMELVNKIHELQRQVADLQTRVRALEAVQERKTLTLPKSSSAQQVKTA